jgi:hypothetical protein
VPRFRTGTVTAVLSERQGLQRVLVDGEAAFVLSDLTGPVGVGDRVVVNVTAGELSLGSAQGDIVHWNLSRGSWSGAGQGHVMKLRYTSLQLDLDVGWREADGEPAPDLPATLGGIPVVACSVHSQVPCVAAAFARAAPGRRLVYVMTDGAALPLALSDLVAAMVAAGLLAGTVTAGHAFGGDLEAVGVPAALALARRPLRADAVVVGMGPGVVGTGTALGTTALEVAPALDAAAALGGRPVVCVRASSADQRGRHQGPSHHTVTALRLVRSPVLVPAPPELCPSLRAALGVQLAGWHEVVEVSPGDGDGAEEGEGKGEGAGVGALLEATGLAVTTMGRGPADDPLFFAAAGAAGTLAGELAGGLAGGRGRRGGARSEGHTPGSAATSEQEP